LGINEEYDETRMQQLVEFYERLVKGLRAWVDGKNKLGSIQDNDSAPPLFRLHQIARQVLPEARLGLQVDELVVEKTNEANSLLRVAEIGFELQPQEFLALASIMRTHDYQPLAPYDPHPAGGQNGEPIIW